jgi:hypothetical protein
MKNPSFSNRNTTREMPAYRVTGLDFFKVLGAIGMVLAHCGLFISRTMNVSQPTPQNTIVYDMYLLIGFFSICLPALAGSSLRVLLDKYIVGNRVLNYDFREVLLIAVTLMVLESVKNTLVHHSMFSFGWDVLHFIALSLVITAALMVKWGQKAVWIFTVLMMAVGALVPAFLSGPDAAPALSVILQLSALIFKVLILLGPSIFCLWFVLKVVPRPASMTAFRKALILSSGLIAGIAVSMFFWNAFSSSFLFKRVAESLPAGALFALPQALGHMWPLAPWYALVGVGFILSDLVMKSSNKQKTSWQILAVSLLVFIAFLIWGFDDYKNLMLEKHYFSSKVFTAPLTVVLGILGFYGLVLSGLTLLFNAVKMQSQTVYNISRGLLLFYFIHFVLAAYLAAPISQMLGAENAMYAFPTIIMILSYVVLRPILRLVDRPLLIQMRKRA